MANETSKEYLEQLCLSVGRAIVAFAQLENAVTIIIADIYQLSDLQERALVRPMSITNKTQVLRLLAKQTIKPTGREVVLAILKRIEDEAERRNNLAHGFYGHKNGKFAILSFSGPARLTGNAVAWTPRKLEAFVQSLTGLRGELSQMRSYFPKSLR
jgi:hypothetical protein